MQGGALGIGSALEYAPAYYADTDELIELCKVAAKYKGKYITHMRSEGERLLEGIDEVIRISREARIPAEIYHFKAAGQGQLAQDGRRHRQSGGRPSRGAGDHGQHVRLHGRRRAPDRLHSAVGHGGGRGRHAPPAARPEAAASDRQRHPHQDRLAELLPQRRLAGQHPAGQLQERSAQTAARQDAGADRQERGKEPVETLCDLLLEDESGIGTVYFITAEENIRKLVPLPWVSFGSDEASQAPEGVFLKSMPHPRAYGNFARVLGKYVRDEKLLPLEAAIRKLTSLPATNLGLDRRGLLPDGYFADVVVFDPKTIATTRRTRSRTSTRWA